MFRHTRFVTKCVCWGCIVFVYVTVGVTSYPTSQTGLLMSLGVLSHAVCLSVCWCSVIHCLSVRLLVFGHTLFVCVSVGVPSYVDCPCVYWCSVTRCLSMCLLVFRHTLFVYVTVGVPSYAVCLCVIPSLCVMPSLSMRLLVFRHTQFVEVSIAVPSYAVCLCVCWCSVIRFFLSFL